MLIVLHQHPSTLTELPISRQTNLAEHSQRECCPVEPLFDSFRFTGAQRGARGIHRSDDQVLNHIEDVDLLRVVAAGSVRTAPGTRMDLRRLARDELVLTGFGTGTTPILLPRGQRILDAANGMLLRPVE